MGPLVRSSAHGWVFRFPVAASLAFFLSVQASNWQRPAKSFHEVMAQPSPHGSYLRRTIKVILFLGFIEKGTFSCMVE